MRPLFRVMGLACVVAAAGTSLGCGSESATHPTSSQPPGEVKRVDPKAGPVMKAPPPPKS